MRILVIGAGLVGSVIVRDLLKYYNDIDEVLIGDIDYMRASRLAGVDRERFSPIKLDVCDRVSLERVLRGIDCVVNATYYGLAHYVIDVSIETKTPYVDLGSSLYRYDDKFRSAGVTAVIDVGGAPGLINMLAKYLVESMDNIDYIHLYDVIKEVRGPYRVNPIRWKYSRDHFG